MTARRSLTAPKRSSLRRRLYQHDIPWPECLPPSCKSGTIMAVKSYTLREKARPVDSLAWLFRIIWQSEQFE